MTGIVNSTGARSGIIGTTVGTPASGMADGTVLQVVQNVNSSEASTTSSTGVVAVTDTITLANATNKVLAIASLAVQVHQGVSQRSYSYVGFTMECTSDTTIHWGPSDGDGYYNTRIDLNLAHLNVMAGMYMIQHLFEPDQDGAIAVTAKAHGYDPASSTIYVNKVGAVQDGRSHITLMEIVAS